MLFHDMNVTMHNSGVIIMCVCVCIGICIYMCQCVYNTCVSVYIPMNVCIFLFWLLNGVKVVKKAYSITQMRL